MEQAGEGEDDDAGSSIGNGRGIIIIVVLDCTGFHVDGRFEKRVESWTFSTFYFYSYWITIAS